MTTGARIEGLDRRRSQRVATEGEVDPDHRSLPRPGRTPPDTPGQEKISHSRQKPSEGRRPGSQIQIPEDQIHALSPPIDVGLNGHAEFVDDVRSRTTQVGWQIDDQHLIHVQ